MKRGKTFLAALTAACLLLGLLPGTALAAGEVKSRGTLDLTADTVDYQAGEGGTDTMAELTEKTIITDSAEGWSWNGPDKILTLSGAKIQTYDAAGIKLPAGATLRLAEGTVSTVTIGGVMEQFSNDTYGVTCAGGLTIDGSGTLNVDNQLHSQKNSYGIHADGALAIKESAKVTASGGMGNSSYGIYGKAGVTISGEAKVTASGGGADQRSHGIFADESQNVEISGTANVTASGGEVYNQTSDGFNKGSAGIQAYQGDVIVSGGTVKATGGEAVGDVGKSYGIRSSQGSVTISGSAQVVAAGGTGGTESTGIDAKKDITVSGDGTSVTARGGDAGSEANSGSSLGITFGEKIMITDAVVDAYGGTAQGTTSYSAGIWTLSGAVELGKAANVTATGGTATEESAGIHVSQNNISKSNSLTLSDDAYAVVKSVGAESSYGIYLGGIDLNILNSARLDARSGTATGDSSGVFVKGNMTVSSSGAVTAIGGTAGRNSCGLDVFLYTDKKTSTLTISDTGTVTATGGVATQGKSSGIRTIVAKIEGGTVKASGEMERSESGYGIDISTGVGNSKIEITGGKVEATGKGGGLSRVPDTLTGCVLVGQKTQGGDWELVIKNAKDYLYTETKPPVSEIKLIGADKPVTIHPNGIYQFGADTVFADDSTLPGLVTWSLQLNSRAVGTAISKSGLLTVAPDETATEITVTATSKADTSKSATATVTVSQTAPDVTGVTLEPKTVKVQRGGDQQFTATVSYDNGTTQTDNSQVSWTVTGKKDPATTIRDGLLTVAAGETATEITVTATSRNGSISDTATVKVTAPTPAPTVTEVALAPEAIEVQRGENQQFNATVKYSDGTTKPGDGLVDWEVTGKQDPATTIDTNGLLTVAEGETAAQLTVTAVSKADTSKSAAATVKVPQPTPAPTVTGVEIAPETIEVLRGGNQQFDATVTYSNGTNQKDNSLVSWSVTNNADPATVIDSNGLLTVAEGETATEITVTAVSKADTSKSAAATVKVTVPQPTPTPAVAGVYLTPASATVRPGGTQQFNAAIRLQDDTYLRDNSLVRWTVTGNSHGGTTVTNGLLTVAAGETAPTVTVTAQSIADASIAASAMVSVYRPETAAPSDDESVGSEKHYNIAVSAGRGGGVSPSGEVRVRQNDGQQLRILPDPGYEIYDVLVDGKSVGALSRYTFTTMRGDHTIEALFVPSFTDVAENAWYRQAVRYAAYNGIFGGTGQGRFSPDLEMSRAMLATVLYRMAGSPALTGAALNAPFTDIDADGWYGPAVRWAWAQDVVNGVGKNSFRPNDPVTREQFVTMLYRFAGQPASGGSLSGFPDADQAEAWAADALKWAVERGLLSGKDGGRLDPKGRATRAEAATILMRYLKEA